MLVSCFCESVGDSMSVAREARAISNSIRCVELNVGLMRSACDRWNQQNFIAFLKRV